MRGRAARWAPVLQLLLLAGLFAMHGLADHGSEAGSDGPMTMAVSSTTVAVAEVAAIPDGSTVAPALDTMPMGAMCVAILVGAIAAWLALRGARPLTAWLPTEPASAPRPRPRSRAPDPPSLSRLSVCRC
ncbi:MULTISPECIES: DUF6153 family protein [unclassified Nocardioides]|uniref:DUF6153 family protein n=1 Tax=unclassified Nocardioides TaxID=2615069 RepID=UPI0009F12DA6|nr:MULTISPECIES: DUF6153 family protein [unclassified Nocardioides]GAW48538.1 Putative uncharacterized protein [Nocardioides sp. PD653-B2]GAW52865.1 putative uncharacterized protein [Nocardioides sp. PD653]